MLHHVPLKRIVGMTVEMMPAVEVILEAWDRIVAQNHIFAAILYLWILRNMGELVAERLFLVRIMIAKDKHFLPIQRLQDGSGAVLITPKHITEDKCPIVRRSCFVSLNHQCPVHFLDGFEWAVVVGQDVLMAIMPV